MKKIFKKIEKNYKQISRRWTWALYRRNRILRARLDDLLKSTDNVRFHIGCGDKKLQGYINIDVVPTEGADILMDVSKDLFLIPSGIASEIRLESVFEHFYQHKQDRILKDFYRILKKGGKLVIKWLPDFDAVIDAYQNKKNIIANKCFDISKVRQYIYGEISHDDSPNELHKDLFTKETMKQLLQHNGFTIEGIQNQNFENEKIAVTINLVAVKVIGDSGGNMAMV